MSRCGLPARYAFPNECASQGLWCLRVRVVGPELVIRLPCLVPEGGLKARKQTDKKCAAASIRYFLSVLAACRSCNRSKTRACQKDNSTSCQDDTSRC